MFRFLCSNRAGNRNIANDEDVNFERLYKESNRTDLQAVWSAPYKSILTAGLKALRAMTVRRGIVPSLLIKMMAGSVQAPGLGQLVSKWIKIVSIIRIASYQLPTSYMNGFLWAQILSASTKLDIQHKLGYADKWPNKMPKKLFHNFLTWWQIYQQVGAGIIGPISVI